jgi:DNA-directed RNA polymerase subunit RPC12/RpoP
MPPYSCFAYLQRSRTPSYTTHYKCRTCGPRKGRWLLPSECVPNRNGYPRCPYCGRTVAKKPRSR